MSKTSSKHISPRKGKKRRRVEPTPSLSKDVQSKDLKKKKNKLKTKITEPVIPVKPAASTASEKAAVKSGAKGVTKKLNVDSNWKQLLQSGKVKKGRKRKRRSPHPSETRAAPAIINHAEAFKKVYAKDPTPTKLIAMDCEMVGVGSQMQSALARVCVINEQGEVLLDKYCKPKHRITDFRTQWSGIRATDLINAPSVESVQQEVADMVRGKFIVGHSLKNDFSVLLINPKRSLVRDTALYKPLKSPGVNGGKWRSKKLQALALQELGWKIQQGEHDPYIDARAALEIYKKHAQEWENDLRRKREGRQQKRFSKSKKHDNKARLMQSAVNAEQEDIFSRRKKT